MIIARRSSTDVLRAIEYIEANYPRIEDPQDVAGAIGADIDQLQEDLQSHIGCKIEAYVHRVRVSHAARIRREQDLKLYAIAREVGYKNDAMLRRNWKKVMGTLPTKQRRTNVAA